VLACLLGLALITPSAPPDGEALIRQMHDKYAGKWYRTLTFVQKTTFTQPSRVETWYESALIPGRLRIDIAPLDSGNAILFRQDSVYRLRNRAKTASRAFVHPLMVLGFDVYVDPAEVTTGKLKALGFDLSKIREDQWQGRPVYVVGAAAGDTTTSQFWVDKERLVFVRMLEPTPDKSGIAETQFNRYQELGKGWIAPEVRFTVNAELKQLEEYSDMRADVELPEALFDPDSYVAPGWAAKLR
jgi:hypothetical protein